jgi:hypothetical protein
MPDDSYSQRVAANGTATILVQSRPNSWLVRQVTVEAATVPSGALCSLKKNGSLVTAITPNRGTASGDPPIGLAPADKMTIEWTGMNAGTLCNAFVEYEVVA